MSEPSRASEAGPTTKTSRTSKPGRKRRLTERGRPTAKRHARTGISPSFFTNGATFAGILSWFPEVENALGLISIEFSVLAVVPIMGSMCLVNFPTYFVRKIRALSSSLWWTIALATAIGFADMSVELKSPAFFGTCPFIAGVSDAIVDMA